jgi:hypothetical protein
VAKGLGNRQNSCCTSVLPPLVATMVVGEVSEISDVPSF